MELHQRQFFDFLLHTAIERWAERLEQRLGGSAKALDTLRSDVEATEVDTFVDAFFADFLLDNPGGACFVLQALERRELPAHAGGRVAGVLQDLARAAFRALLLSKTEEALEQRSGYQGVTG